MKKILVVEDETDIRESLLDLLSMKGFEVYTATNGKEGLFMATTLKPELIVSDIMMPEMNGLELLEIIQKNNELANTPFVFLTARAEHVNLREGMNLGADDYLTKPVKNQELLDVINRRLAKSENIKKSIEEEYKDILNKLNSTAQHEFNTPLNGILGFANLLKTRSNITKQEMEKFADIIETSGMRLQATLDNMVLYRELKTKTFKNTVENFIFDEDLICSITQVLALKYKREADVEIKPFHSIKINGSLKSLQKILHEVIDNSFKFSHKGDRVIIETVLNNHQHLIQISDNGRGMKDEDIRNVDAFLQFETQMYEQQGLGLGLYLSKELAKMNKWSLNLYRGMEKGMVCQIVV